MSDYIYRTVNMATIPSRIETCAQAVNSLYDQCNCIELMLNGHTREDARKLRFLIKDSFKVNFHFLDNSMTDAAKYFMVDKQLGYIFTCDDDLEYAPNYCDYMIQKIEQYERKAVITLHGRVWPYIPSHDEPIASFYRDRKEGVNIPGGGAFQALSEVKGDHYILSANTAGCGGDGVMAWHSDTIKMSFDYCLYPNMSQLWMALKCNEDRVPQIVVEHQEGFVTQLWDGPGIWDDQIYNDGIQTDLVNKRWRRWS